MLSIKDFNKITKEEFVDAYNQHPPNRYSKFVYKYFSTSTEKEDIKLKNTIRYTLLGVFGVGFVSTVFEWNKIIPIATWIYAIGLFGIVFFISGGVLLNTFRLKKISKNFGVSKNQFNVLARKFL